jgi:hypothetical protein
MSDNKLILVFDIYNDGEYLGKKEFSQEAVAMGSGKNAALHVENASLNAFEVVFNMADGKVTMSDLVGKSRLLLCNGLPVKSNVVINNGDVINIGVVRLEVSFLNSAQQADDVTQPNSVLTSKEDAFEEDLTDPGAVPAITPEPAPQPMSQPPRSSPSPSLAKSQPISVNKTSGSLDDENAQKEQPPLQFVKTYSPKLSEQNTSGPTVLEVAQIFGKEVIDVKHFAKRALPITIGSDTGYRFRFASQPIAWVPKAISKLAGLMYPFTEANEEWKSDFFVPLEQSHGLFEVTKNGTYCNIDSNWTGYVEENDQLHSFADMARSNAIEKVDSGYRVSL